MYPVKRRFKKIGIVSYKRYKSCGRSKRICKRAIRCIKETSKKQDSFRLWQKGQESTRDTRTLTKKGSPALASGF